MSRFSMVVAEPKYQMFSELSYKLKDNEDKDSPINNWIGTEERCKEMLKWLNENVGSDSEFDFWALSRKEEIEYLEGIFECEVNIAYASINNILLIKFGTPIHNLRGKLSIELGINIESISLYNTESWNEWYVGGDDLAIINMGMI